MEVLAFNFSDALCHLNAGKKVSRLAWGEAIKYLELPTNSQAFLLVTPATTEWDTDFSEKYTVTLNDIHANDWFLIQED